MILYDESECLFDTNGYGRLEEAIRATAIEEQNGEYTLEVEYPISGKRYSVIKTGMIILARHEDSSDQQPFRIYRISRPLSGRVTIYARHVSYDLANVPMLPFTALTARGAMGKLQTNPNFGSPFSFWTDIEDDTPFTTLAPASVRQVLGGAEESILAQYGGEYKFDKYAVRLYAHRGEDNGVSIRYGKNLTELLRDTDTDGRYSAVMPFYNNSETGEIVTLPELTLPISGASTFPGDYKDQTGTDYDNGTEAYTGVTSETKVYALDISEAFWQAPTVAELRAEAQKRIKGMGAGPADSLKVSFINLWDTQEYQNYAPLQTVLIGDTVHVYYTALGVNVTMRVIKTVYDLINNRYTSIELGTPTYTMNQAVAGISEITASAEARNALMKASKSASSVVETQTQLISGQTGGNYVIDKDASGHPIGWLIMDTADKATARNVLRANLSGIGFSPNGYNGPFTTAWTIDGKFNADFIQTGALNADLIKAGSISDAEGKFYLDMETGELVMQDGTFSGTVNATGGTIGGFTVDAEKMVYEETATSYGLTIKPDGASGTVLNNTRNDWQILSDSSFGIAAGGYYYGQRYTGGGFYSGNSYFTYSGVSLYNAYTQERSGISVRNSGGLLLFTNDPNGIFEVQAPIEMQGALTGSTAETVSGSYNGLTITLYKNAGAVTCYIRGTTTAAMATASAYVTLFTPADSSWMPTERMITFHLLTGSGYRGQVNPSTTNIQIGYTRNASNATADIPAGTAIYCMLTWAAK